MKGEDDMPGLSEAPNAWSLEFTGGDAVPN